MKQPDLRPLIYTTAFQRCQPLIGLPGPTKQPSDFNGFVQLLVNEIKTEARLFYGTNATHPNPTASTQSEANVPAHARSSQHTHALPVNADEKLEAQYPGIDYTNKAHRKRLKKFVNHVRLFYALDILRLTKTEIYQVAHWEGTLWHRQKGSKNLGKQILDTTGNEIPNWKDVETRARLDREKKKQMERLAEERRQEQMDGDGDESMACIGDDGEQGPGFDSIYSSPVVGGNVGGNGGDAAVKDEEDEGNTTASSGTSSVVPFSQPATVAAPPTTSRLTDRQWRNYWTSWTPPIQRDPDAATQVSYLRSLEQTQNESYAFVARNNESFSPSPPLPPLPTISVQPWNLDVPRYYSPTASPGNGNNSSDNRTPRSLRNIINPNPAGQLPPTSNPQSRPLEQRSTSMASPISTSDARSGLVQTTSRNATTPAAGSLLPPPPPPPPPHLPVFSPDAISLLSSGSAPNVRRVAEHQRAQQQELYAARQRVLQQELYATQQRFLQLQRSSVQDQLAGSQPRSADSERSTAHWERMNRETQRLTWEIEGERFREMDGGRQSGAVGGQQGSRTGERYSAAVSGSELGDD